MNEPIEFPGEVERGNGWGEYSRLVMAEIHRLDLEIKSVNFKLDDIKEHVTEIKVRTEDLPTLRIDISKLHNDIVALKVKAGVWGLAGASIPIFILILLEAMKKL